MNKKEKSLNSFFRVLPWIPWPKVFYLVHIEALQAIQMMCLIDYAD